MVRVSENSAQLNFLTRRALNNPQSSLTDNQITMDNIQASFTHQASDVGNLLAMTGGAFAFRFTRLGMQSLGLAKSFATVGALGAETIAFRGSSNLVNQLRGQTPQEEVLDLRGLATTFITLGSLKGAGYISRKQNIFLSHAFTSGAMVGSHNLAYGLGITTAPHGTILEQLAHAEADNLALGMGQAAFGMMTGGRVAMAERRLDLLSEVRSIKATPVELRSGRESLMPVMASEGQAQLANRRIPANWPQEFSARWVGVKDGTNLYTPESTPRVTNNRGLVNAILEHGVFGMLGKANVHAVIGYGSGFDGFKPEASVRSREIDNKIDLVVVVNTFEGALGHLSELWGFDSAQREGLLSVARRGGVYCPNPDMLLKGSGLAGFKLTVVDRAHFYSSVDGKPALHFAQFRVKDAIFAEASDPRNRLLYIDEGSNGSQLEARGARDLENHIKGVQDRMMDFAYNLKASFLAALRHPIRFFRPSFSGADLGRWFYQFSYDIEAYRFWEWSKGTKLFNKRSKEAGPILLGAIQRFAERYKNELKVTDDGVEISPQEISLVNLYDVRFSDRSFSSYVAARVRSVQTAPVLFSMIRRAWAGSSAAMQSLRFSRSYEYIDNATYGGRKARGWIYKDDKVVYPLWALAHVLRRIAPNKIDSIQHPVIFTRLGIQINELYRKGKINDAEWEILNAAWMSDPAMTRLRNVPVLEVFDLNIPTSAVAQQAYAKFLDSILQTPHMDQTVIHWVQARRDRLSQ